MDLPVTRPQLPSVYAGDRYTIRVRARSNMRLLGHARERVLRAEGSTLGGP